jgi:hypothetical protein
MGEVLYQLLNIHGINDVRHMSDLYLVVSRLELLLKNFEDVNHQALIEAGGNTLRFEIHKLINSIWIKEELPQLWKESIIVPVC